MKVKYIKLNLIVVMLLLFATLITLFGGVGVTYAAETNYSNVLDDLRKDSNFNVLDYPAYDTNSDSSSDGFYRLEVFQIAESTGGDLFVYVYQPAAKVKFLKATQVNMSLTDKMGGIVTDETELTDKDKPKLYNLTFLNGAGVFQKYRVDGLKIAADEVRYYNIASIYRDWIKGIDKETGNDNTYNFVAFAVSKLFTVKNDNGIISYFCDVNDTVEIIEPFSDFVQYYNGFELFPTRCDSHYVAFSIDKPIDYLLEATLSYVTYDVTSLDGLEKKVNRKEHPSEKITGTDTGENSPNGWFSTKYKWNRIVRVDDFINNSDNSISNEIKQVLKGKQWVLRFLETERSVSNLGHVDRQNYTSVEEVTILRLKFRYGKDTYDLGAVSDTVTGDKRPSNGSEEIGFWAYVWRCIYRLFKGTATLVEQIVAVVAIFICLMFLPLLLLIISLCSPAFAAVMKSVLRAIGKVLLWLLKGLWWVVCLPFKGIAALINKKRGD